MKKKPIHLEGGLDKIPEHQIYLNINHLNNGTYVLKIMHKNKVISSTIFKKSK